MCVFECCAYGSCWHRFNVTYLFLTCLLACLSLCNIDQPTYILLVTRTILLYRILSRWSVRSHVLHNAKSDAPVSLHYTTSCHHIKPCRIVSYTESYCTAVSCILYCTVLSDAVVCTTPPLTLFFHQHYSGCNVRRMLLDRSGQESSPSPTQTLTT